MTAQQSILGYSNIRALANQGAAYLPIAGWDQSNGGLSEAQAQVVVRAASTATALFATVLSGFGAFGSSTVKLRQNGANSALGVTIPSNGSGVFSDTSDTVTLASGDLIDIVVNNVWPLAVLLTLQSSGQCSTIIAAADTFAGSGGAYFSPVTSSGSPTEADAQIPSVEAATLSNLQANVSYNPSTTTSTVRTRVNAANGGQSVSISAAATGQFEDTSHSDSIASGDLWNFSLSGASSNVSLSASVKYLGAVANQVALPTGGANMGNVSPEYYSAFGYMDPDQAGVSDNLDYASAVPVPCTVSLTTVKVSNNSETGTQTYGSRVNGANGNQSVSVSSGATGTFQDTTHSDILNAGDLFSWRYSGTTNGHAATINALYTSKAPAAHYTQGCAAVVTAAGTAAEIIARVQAAKGSATAAATAARKLGKGQKGTVTPTGLAAKSIGLVRTATTAGASLAIKVLGTARAGTATAAAVLQRNLGIVHLGAVTPTAASAALVARMSTVFAVASPSGVFFRSVGKTVAIAAIVTPSGSIGRALSVVRLAVATGAASLQRLLGFNRTAAATALGLTGRVLGTTRLASAQPTGIIQVIKARVLTVLAAASAMGAASRSVATFKFAAAAAVATVAKRSPKALTGAATPPATATRAHGRLLVGVVTAGTSFVHTADKVLIAVTAASATWRRAISVAVAAIVTPASSVARFIPRSYVGSTAPVGLATKRIPRSYASATTPIANSSRLPIKLLVTVTAPIMSMQRFTAKQLVASVMPQVSMGRRITITLVARSLAIGLIVHRKLRTALGQVLSGLARRVSITGLGSGVTIVGREAAPTIKGSPD